MSASTQKIPLPPEIRELFREAGRRGGKKTVERHGKELFQRIGSVGGSKSKRKTAEPEQVANSAS
jgi:general stress protein YciG